LSPGRTQLDVQKAAAKLVTEVPYDEAQRLFGDLTGVGVSSERMHTFTNQVAEGLTVLDVAPSRDEIERRIAEVAAGRFRRPVLVLGIDGAYVPSRPESARGRRPGQARHRARRAQWRHEWREAKGFRFYLLDGERIVHVLSWHQVQNEHELGEALRQVKEAGLIPQETVRLCVVCDGAEWIWKHVQTLFPHARQVLDYYHCAEYLHKMAKAQYVDSVGQGRVWTGAQAKDRGLVDEFGGLDRAIEVAKQLAKIPADKGVERVILPYPTTFLQQLLTGSDDNANTQLEQQRAVLAAMPEDVRRAFRYMQLMDRMKNGESMLLMPFDLQIK